MPYQGCILEILADPRDSCVPLCSPRLCKSEGLNDGTVQGVNSSWMVDFMQKLIGWDTGIMWVFIGMAGRISTLQDQDAADL